MPNKKAVTAKIRVCADKLVDEAYAFIQQQLGGNTDPEYRNRLDYIEGDLWQLKDECCTVPRDQVVELGNRVVAQVLLAVVGRDVSEEQLAPVRAVINEWIDRLEKRELRALLQIAFDLARET